MADKKGATTPKNKTTIQHEGIDAVSLAGKALKELMSIQPHPEPDHRWNKGDRYDVLSLAFENNMKRVESTISILTWGVPTARLFPYVFESKAHLDLELTVISKMADTERESPERCLAFIQLIGSYFSRNGPRQMNCRHAASLLLGMNRATADFLRYYGGDRETYHDAYNRNLELRGRILGEWKKAVLAMYKDARGNFNEERQGEGYFGKAEFQNSLTSSISAISYKVGVQHVVDLANDMNRICPQPHDYRKHFIGAFYGAIQLSIPMAQYVAENATKK